MQRRASIVYAQQAGEVGQYDAHFDNGRPKRDVQIRGRTPAVKEALLMGVEWRTHHKFIMSFGVSIPLHSEA